MTRKTKDQTAKAKLDADLDEALEETFPASDPPQMTEPPTAAQATRKRPGPRRANKGALRKS